MNPFVPVLPVVFSVVAISGTSALAQWSSDSTMHQVIADGLGEQVQPKLSPCVDGGCYISWFSSVSGYDVRLQRLDAQGNPMWGDNGILIADRGYSSTQDYDLDTDAEGFAVLAYRDNRFGGDRITAQRVSPEGQFMWGVDGIQFSDGIVFVASPDVATTSDGSSVIGWGSDSETRLAKIQASGEVAWETSISEPGLTTLIASMHGAGNGSVVLSWVQYAFFLGAKTLHAQMIGADGSETWASRSVVYDGGSLQFGNFPEFVASSDGSSTFAWYDTANSLQVYVQRLAGDGSELFVHNGVPASTAPRERVSPCVTYNAANDTAYVSWVELDNNQGNQGVYAQAIDNKGSRLWGDSGVVLSATDANPSGSINTQVIDNNLVTLWIEGTGSFGSDVINSTRLNNAGSAVWSTQVASNPAQRARLATSVSSDDFVIAAWQIGGFGDADIESHNLNPDGTLGVIAGCPADLTGNGVLDFFDISAFLNAFNAQDPAADFTGEGIFDFFDVSAFLAAFGAGCP